MHEHNTTEKIHIQTGTFRQNDNSFEGRCGSINPANIINDLVEGYLKERKVEEVDRSCVMCPTGLTMDDQLCQTLLDAGVGAATIDKELAKHTIDDVSRVRAGLLRQLLDVEGE